MTRQSGSGNLPIRCPDGKKFAFTIIDDTDVSTVENARPIYDLLSENGLRTTKTVWPLQPSARAITGGDSLDNPEYREWVQDLRKRGFEIALHGVADGSSSRARIIEGLDEYKRILGEYPVVHVNHVGQSEGIYWGADRFDFPVRWLYRLYRRQCGSEPDSFGADEVSPHFWGDLCRKRLKYVRNMVFQDINTLKMDPLMPYHDPRRSYVRHWFSSSYGSGINAFCEMISEANQDRLEAEGGACILYSHLGSTFYPLRADLKHLIRRLSERDGWFVPVTTLLDFLGTQRGWCDVSQHRTTFQMMQWNWFLQQSAKSRPVQKIMCALPPRLRMPLPRKSPFGTAQTDAKALSLWDSTSGAD